jgi:hypothetical protein
MPLSTGIKKIFNYKIWKESDNPLELAVEGMILSECILRNSTDSIKTLLIRFRLWSSDSIFEHGDKFRFP